MKLDITVKYSTKRKKGFNANKVIVFSCLGNPFRFSGVPNLFFSFIEDKPPMRYHRFITTNEIKLTMYTTKGENIIFRNTHRFAKSLNQIFQRLFQCICIRSDKQNLRNGLFLYVCVCYCCCLFICGIYFH